MPLTKLFEPGRIGKLDVKNRLVMAPMGTFSATMDGYMTDHAIDYYLERARGGIGLIVPSGSAVMAKYRLPHMFAIYEDRFIPGLTRLAKALHQADTKVLWQLSHPGVAIMHGWKGYERPPEIEAVGPSEVPCARWGAAPRALTKGEIRELVDKFGEAAVRAREAGFDGVEVHAAHGYSLSAFLSPFKNRRNDEYGGSIENRARIVCEILAKVRAKVGPDFPLSLRLNGSDFFKGGITIEDTVKQAPLFVKAGVNLLSVSAGAAESTEWRDLTYLYPDGAIVHLAEAIKRAVNVPVVAVGKIGDPFLAERILQEGRADFIAMARALLADPEWPNKVREGRFDSIQRCIYCNNCRLGRRAKQGADVTGLGLSSCTVNPALMREREFAIKPTSAPKRVMVVGGGLAGMEAARVLAQRGHKVSLYERGSDLGGQWSIVCQEESKHGFANLKERLVRGLKTAGVQVTLNKEVTSALVAEKRPEVVVLATGARPASLPVPGIDNKNVVQATEVIAGRANVGGTVVVVGGRLVGMEVAESLARQGKKVTLVTKKLLGENGAPIERNLYVTLRNRLVKAGVPIFANSPLFEVTNEGVFIVYDNKELLYFPADTVVLAIGFKSEDGLSGQLEKTGIKAYKIGDCVEPRNALEAVREGAELGRQI